jgi:cytochrome c-type biogenesis protein CcmH/NrfF
MKEFLHFIADPHNAGLVILYALPVASLLLVGVLHLWANYLKEKERKQQQEEDAKAQQQLNQWLRETQRKRKE